MTIYDRIHNNLFETINDYFGESEANDPAYNLELLTWAAVLAADAAAVNDESEARELAIAWQQWQSEVSMSIGDLSEWSAYFEELAERFNLKDEFTENAII